MSGKGSGTTETTKSTNYAPWISQAQQGAFGAAMAQNLPAILRTSEFSRAGFNPDQMKGFDLFRNVVNDYSDAGRTMVPPSMFANPGITPAQMQAYASDAATSNAASADAQLLGANDYEEFFSPYKQTVIDSTMNNMRRERDNNNAAVSAQAAARGGFGGSGEALGIAQNNRNFQSDAGQLSAQLMDQGFNTAQGLASANADRRQQTELSNAQFEQQNNLANADRLQQTSIANADSRQQASATNAGYAQQAGLAGLDNLYRLLALDDGFKDSDLKRQLTLAQALSNVGAFQQQDMQSILDQPFEALARLYGFIPQIYDQTTVGTQPDNSPNPLAQMLGIGGKIAFNSMFPGVGV